MDRLLTASSREPDNPILRRLDSFASLDVSDGELIRGLGDRRGHRPGESLVGQGDHSERTRFVIDGWACKYRLLPNGERQILEIVLPGDQVPSRPRHPHLYGIAAITAVETVDGERLIQRAQDAAAGPLARALAAIEVDEKARLLDHVVRLGRQSAHERVAHFLLELHHRLNIAGRVDGKHFTMPLTQEMLGDALGLSAVHTNRTLQRLRGEGLIELRSGVAAVLQWDRLNAVANYQPAARRPVRDVRAAGLEAAPA